MNDTTTSRRQMLQTLSTAGGLTVLGVSGGSAAPGQQVRVIESGLRYDVPDEPQYDGHHVDSRPPYTVDSEGETLLLTPRASSALEREISGDENLVNERTPGDSKAVPLGRSGKRQPELPVSLSVRMRVTEAISLASPHTHPTVTVNWNPEGAAVTVESRDRIELDAGASKEVSLDPVTVEARTVEFVERQETSDHDSDETAGDLERVYDSVEIEATPVVEVVDHGRLTVERMDPPGEASGQQ